MMEDFNYTIRSINLKSTKEKKEITDFLERHNLALDPDVEYTCAIFNNDSVIATGSISGRVLKCITVDTDYRYQGLTNKIVTHLVLVEFDRKNEHLFIYTSPDNVEIFKSLGFYNIYTVPGAVTLLENIPDGISGYLDNLKEFKKQGNTISAIVVNCNPFTLGHRYLIETASKESDIVHVFVLSEDRSIFPSDVRFKLVKEGTKDIKNVYVHKATDYIISQATFPSYFLKESKKIVDTHARLDLGIFAEIIAPALDIKIRFVGEEPLDPVTSHYNLTMKTILPKYGIKVIEIPRKENNGNVISASIVRKLIKEDKFDEIKKLVPESTYNYLVSDNSGQVIEKIKEDSV